MVRPLLLAAVAAMSSAVATHADEAAFYVGTFARESKETGIFRAELDLATGKLSPLQKVADAKNPGFVTVSPDGRFLYAAMELQGGAAGAFQIKGPGALHPLNEKSSSGSGACHVSIAGNHVFIANYNGGNFAWFATEKDGKLKDSAGIVAFEGSGPDPKRQDKPYAHAVNASPDGRHVYVCDLGTDSVWGFRLDPESSALTATEPAAGRVPPGGGPRHMSFSPDGRFVYVNNEMGMSVSTFARDAESGALTLLQTLPTLPEGVSKDRSSTAEILTHPGGRWVYVSNRGHDSITVFKVRDDGQLEFLENQPSVAKVPRGMGMDPQGKWLVVAGQDDGALVSFRVGEDGRLSKTDRLETNTVPVCVAFVPKS